MTRSSIFNKFRNVLNWNNKVNPVNLIPQRFILAFKDHGIVASQIPRLLPQIQLSNLKSENTLLQVLNYEILEQTAQLFGIRRQWLEGVDNQIYEFHSCYKDPAVFFNDLISFCHRKDTSLFLPVRAFTTRKGLDFTDTEYQPLALVLSEQIATLDDKDIFRYHIFNDEWDWSYAPTRIQVKAMVRLVSAVINVQIPLYVIEPNDIEALFGSTIIPGCLIGNRLISDPSLEDFTISGYPISRETDELPEVLKYIEEHELRSFITKEQWKYVQSSKNSEIFPGQSGKIHRYKRSGKRERNNQQLWEPVREIARAWWAKEGDTLTISEAVRRIKELKHLKASGLKPNTIHKHIADLATNHKSGCRTKNSPKLSS
ncbi:hypothetical protein [Nitrosomonas sp. Is37]|uniref:hypothetical protein n=1 Tax=Nitrosomonas sp. Is37 TaxID=3080535 RepID=UPI00294B148D|nr:hypothetical protein [Nitrosomonas sp. Is37]MDV6345710.1 hypothetical protein [Nitrosomonas sp. Is37]